MVAPPAGVAGRAKVACALDREPKEQGDSVSRNFQPWLWAWCPAMGDKLTQGPSPLMYFRHCTVVDSDKGLAVLPTSSPLSYSELAAPAAEVHFGRTR